MDSRFSYGTLINENPVRGHGNDIRRRVRRLTMRKTVVAIVVIIGCLIYFGVAYSQTSAQGGEGGKGSAGQGGKGGDGTVIIGNQQPTPPPKDDPKVDVEQIKRLIRDLDADDIAVRDKATDELKKIGKPALVYLEESAKSDSPEVAWRSKIIINAIKKAEQQKQPEPEGSTSRKIGPNITINGAMPSGFKSSVMIRDASGKITLTVTEYDKDGKENIKTYEAKSPEEFKQKYPEIAKEYGIGEKPPTTINIPDFEFDDIFNDLGKSWGRQWGDMQKEIDRLRDMFSQQGRQPPQAPKPESEDILPPQSSVLSDTDLGISIIEVDDKLLVNNVEPNGLGAQIGLKKSDTIVSVNGIAVGNLWQCRRQINDALKKNKVNVTVIRKNQKEILIYPR